MSARKIGFLILILLFGAVVETTWHVREDHYSFGPEGCRVLGGRFYGPSFDFEEAAERTLEADEAPEVEVRNAFGSVRVLPGDGPVVQVKLRKVVFQPTEEKARAVADRIEIRIEEDEGRLRVGTNRDDVGRNENAGFETHLELRVPPQTRAVIRTDHARVEASGVASARIRASFDDVHVDNIAGPVKIDARQGMVEVTDLDAGLSLKQRHGETDATGVAGTLDIDFEHGKLRARRVGGLEGKAGFAEVVLAEVEGDVKVDGRRTSLRASDVTGRVEAETSYAAIRLERVGGDVRAKADRGAVTAEDVKGALTAETVHEDVQLDRIEGPVEVTVRHGGLTASELGQGARVRIWDEDVSIRGSRGPVEVEVERGDIVFAPGTPITEALTLSAKDGGIRLEVPAGSRFELEAESRRGAVDVDVPALDVAASRSGARSRATGAMGGGGARASLTADEDVTVTTGSTDIPAEQP